MKYYTRFTFDNKTVGNYIQDSGDCTISLNILFSLICHFDSGYPSYNFPREVSLYRQDIEYNKVLELCKVKKWKI